jgi:hypothetical protein
MPKDIKTNVVVGVQTKGISEANQKTTKFNKGLIDALNAQAKGFAEAVKNIEKLCRATERAGEKTVRTTQRTTEAIKKRTAAEKEAERAAKQTLREAEREAKRVERQAQRDEQTRRGAFRQGLIQGGLPMPAAFLQRGPGMGRQLAGMAVGGAIGGTLRQGMGIGGGLASAAFTGIGGVQQALSGIPIVGGAAAGMLGAAAGYAQQHIQFQRQRIGMASILTAPMERKRVAQRNEAVRKWQRETDKLSSLQDELRYSQYNREVDLGGGMRIAPPTEEMLKSPLFQGAEFNVDRAALPKERRIQSQIKKQQAAVAKMQVGARKRLRTGLENVGGLGLQLMGVGREEAEKAAAAIAQVGGGRMGEAQRQGMVETGFAAKTMYGIQEGVSGAFLRGGRRGGLEGARGQAGRAMTEAIQDGLRLGLEGSELNDYMQSIAAGIQQFEMTGIPVAKESIAGMSQAFAISGIAGTRAARLGQGLTSYVQGMGQRGVKSSLDLLMLQRLGGFQGGGAAELQESFIRMEKMKGAETGKSVSQWNMQSAMSNLLREVIQLSGGGPGGEMALRDMLAKMQVNMTQGEIKLLGRRLTQGALTPDEQAQADMEFQRRLSGEEEAGFIGRRDKAGRMVGLTRGAAQAVGQLGPSARAQAAIGNRQLAMGGRMVGAVQALERSAINTNEAFTKLIDGPLKNFGDWLEKMTGSLKGLVDKGQKGQLTAGDVAGTILRGATGAN